MTCCAKNTKKHYYQNKKKGTHHKNLIIRKKREKKLIGSFKKQDVKNIRLNLNDKCAYCNEPLKGKGEMDHIISIKNGGTNFAKNMTLSCRWCNRNKRTKSANEFLAWRKICGLKNRKDISNGRKI